ncbi:MAG TPA: hypothetical protein PKZ08_14575, partial [Vicinamibacterales bacterium]|nr:hypothetical protein [Vicinamibacterales bacterium]
MRRIPLERAALWLLYGTVAALQVSIAAAQTLLALMLVAWIAMLTQGRARPGAPPFFRALAVYAVFTLAATVFSVEPLTSLVDD